MANTISLPSQTILIAASALLFPMIITPTWPLGVIVELPLLSATQAAVTPPCISGFLNQWHLLPLQRNMITDIFKDAQDPLTNLFLTVVGQKYPLGQRRPPKLCLNGTLTTLN